MFENMMGRYGGFKLFHSNAMVERKQVRFPRSKTRRIRKKWAKRPGNWATIPRTDVLIDSINYAVYAHPLVVGEIEHALAKELSKSMAEQVDKRMMEMLSPDVVGWQGDKVLRWTDFYSMPVVRPEFAVKTSGIS